MKTIADFIEGLAKGAGIEVDADTVKALQGNQIPDEFAGNIQSAYFTRETAYHDKEIKRKAVGAALGGIETAVWQFCRDQGITKEQFNEKFRTVDDNGNYKNSILDDIKNVLPLLGEHITTRAEEKNGLSTKELRDKIASEKDAEYRDKLAAMKATNDDLTGKLSVSSKQIETMNRDFDQRVKANEIKTYVTNMVNKIPLKPQIKELQMEDDVRTKAINSILDGYHIDHDEQKDWTPFRKEDPTARALDGKNQPYSLEGLIAETMSIHIDPNGGKTGDGKGDNKFKVIKTDNGDEQKRRAGWVTL